MEIYPEKRVFHIDKECYIIYLGSDPNDYKPFLRIGNSKFLPDIIKNNTYYIVITDSLTGNPLLEPQNMNKDNIHENKYVGDKKGLSEFFNFLNCFNIKTEGYPITDKLQTNENKAVLSYFDNGNLTLHYDKSLIFDLKKREKDDLHFIELAKNIKDQLKSDPLFLSNDYFKSIDYGFINIGNSVIHINNDQFIVDELPENYFENLAYNRLDPDLISTIILNSADEDLIHILKRKLSKNEKLNIITKNEDKILSCTINLFRKKNDLFTVKNRINLEDISIKIDNNQTTVKSNKLKTTIITVEEKRYISKLSNSKSEDEKTLYINKASKEISYITESEVINQPLVEGIPYIINNDTEINTAKTENNIDDTISFFKNHIGFHETNLINTLKSLLKSQIKEDYLLAENYLKSSEKLAKHFKPAFPALLIILSLLNLTKYLVLKNKNYSFLNRLTKMENKLKANIPRLGKTKFYLPLTANIFTNHPIIIFTLSKSGLSSSDYQYSIDNEREIVANTRINPSLFEESKTKLIQLIENLTERRLAIVGKTKLEHVGKEEIIAQEKLEKSEDKEQKEATEPGKIPAKSIEKTGALTPGKNMKTYKRHGKRKLLLIIIPIIAVLVVIGLYILISSKNLKENISISQIQSEDKTSSQNIENINKSTEITAIEKKESSTLEEKTTSESNIDLKNEGISKKKIETFLDLGYIKITILDVYNLTNKIAKSNGYRTLDNPNELGRDPNWIYPGNRFKLPDNSTYTVVKGDTIWYIAKRFIKKELDADWPVYQQIKETIKKADYDNKTKQNIISKLTEFKNRTYSENFKKLLDKTIKSLKE